MKCDFCGCYIPDKWEQCPACGAVHSEYPELSPLAKAILNGERISSLDVNLSDLTLYEYLDLLVETTPKMPTSYTY